ncbi:hypothetical protein VNO78_07301 [Psophocarpus tetragonolobus]|uniref:Uncharacterized protein n=1 Tax=Psophocarpus tetragonolobus TaxID=3891 RepID=A0AAN9SSU5_PSOTE
MSTCEVESEQQVQPTTTKDGVMVVATATTEGTTITTEATPASMKPAILVTSLIVAQEASCPVAHQRQMIFHYHKERVVRLDHCTLTPEVALLWNAESTEVGEAEDVGIEVGMRGGGEGASSSVDAARAAAILALRLRNWQEG